ncbi:MAG: Uma2 family endonuclease [Polyangiaceae bacterium]
MAVPVRTQVGDPLPLPTIPTVPTVDAWRAMTPQARLDFQIRVIDALNAAADVMGEGRPHKKAKTRTLDALGLHFKAIGRTVYLAEEMPVLYPGTAPFTPDILAVLDVEEPEEDERMTWVVADEGKGLDLVIEVLYQGDRNKDLVDNVERYAGLGIPEYFVFDRWSHKLHAYRLPAPGAGRYQPIVPQYGRYRSNVLGLDLSVFGPRLRFLAGEAELPGSARLIDQLQVMLLGVEARAEQARAEAADAEAEAAKARAEASRARAMGVLAVLRARGLAVPDAVRERVLAEHDAQRLDRWMEKAITATSVDEALAEGG